MSLEVHSVDAGDHRSGRRGSPPRRRSCACLRLAHGDLGQVRLQRAAEQLAEAGDAAVDAPQVVVDVAEVLVQLVGRSPRSGRARSRRRRLTAARPRGEVEHLALELVDPLGRVGALAREDLALDFLDIDVDALRAVPRSRRRCGQGSRRGPRRSRGGAGPDAARSAAAPTQLALAMAHGDDEVRVDEDQQLADLDHLVGVDVAGGLDDDQQGVAVELDLRPLMSVDRILDRELVQVELRRDLLELGGVGLEDAEPDEGAGAGDRPVPPPRGSARRRGGDRPRRSRS